MSSLVPGASGCAPFEAALGFWKLLEGDEAVRGLVGYDERLSLSIAGIRILRAPGEAAPYRLVTPAGESRLFAAVHPLAAWPDGAEILAEVRDAPGECHSAVLWYPAERCVVLPFDPDAAVDAFRYERYVPPARRTVLPGPVLAAYYTLKPLIPSGVRRTLRSVMASRASATEHFLAWPADRSQDVLLQLLLRVMMLALGRTRLPFVWFWPEGRPWAVVLTHDVETGDGLARVPEVMRLEAGRGLRSSFNLVPRDYEAPASLLAEMAASGFEVGVHGYTHDGLMFSDWPTFTRRAAAVNGYARAWGASGFRSPATYRNLEWFHLLEFEYDSSVTDTAPYEPQPGGCASLFPYTVGSIVELPMTLPQDHTLFSLLGHADGQVWLDKLALIRESHGLACVLTHPDPASGYIGMPENEQRYLEVLDVVAASDAWTPLPREAARWWRTRSEWAPSLGDRLEGFSAGTAVLDEAGALRLVPPGES